MHRTEAGPLFIAVKKYLHVVIERVYYIVIRSTTQECRFCRTPVIYTTLIGVLINFDAHLGNHSQTMNEEDEGRNPDRTKVTRNKVNICVVPKKISKKISIFRGYEEVAVVLTAQIFELFVA